MRFHSLESGVPATRVLCSHSQMNRPHCHDALAPTSARFFICLTSLLTPACVPASAPASAQVQLYQGVLQGSSSPGFSMLVFSGQMGASMEPSSTTKNYHLDPAVDHTILLALRQWASERFVSPSYGVCFSDVKPPQFLDIRCQLVAKAAVDHRTTILKVPVISRAFSCRFRHEFS